MPKEKRSEKGKENSKHKKNEDKTVDVDFEFFDPTESDFHGIKSFLAMERPDVGNNVSELADAIVNQTRVGSVIKVDGEVFGFVSCLDYETHEEKGFMKQMRDTVLSNCPKNQKKAFSRLFEEASSGKHRLGVVYNERMVNCPPELAYPLMVGLFDEIDWATEDEPTPDLQQSYKFSRYLFCARADATSHESVQNESGKDDGGSEDERPAKKRKQHSGKQEKHKGAPVDDALFFSKFEDESFYPEAEPTMKFPFTLSRKQADDTVTSSRMVVYVVPKERIRPAITQIQNVLDPTGHMHSRIGAD